MLPIREKTGSLLQLLQLRGIVVLWLASKKHFCLYFLRRKCHRCSKCIFRLWWGFSKTHTNTKKKYPVAFATCIYSIPTRPKTTPSRFAKTAVADGGLARGKRRGNKTGVGSQRGFCVLRTKQFCGGEVGWSQSNPPFAERVLLSRKSHIIPPPCAQSFLSRCSNPPVLLSSCFYANSGPIAAKGLLGARWVLDLCIKAPSKICRRLCR